MFKDFQEAEKFVRDNDVRMVDLKFVDLWGRWHHVTITASEFTQDLMREGIGFDGSSVGFKSVGSGDMALIPDLSTGFMDEFCEVETLSFICKIVEADSKATYLRDPRTIAIRTEEYLRSTGIADYSLWGPEFEFYVFNEAYFDNKTHTASYRVESVEADWNNPDGGLGMYLPAHGGYHAIPPRDQTSNLRTRMVMALEDAGVAVKYHHHEVGGPGQCEIETPMLGNVEAADASMMIKYVVRNVAIEDGQTVTFLPKPLFGEAGSGMHFHQQLFKDGKNAFYDAKGPNLMSELALFYIGGLLKHAPAVLAFTNPSTNSYRRLVPGYEAPVNCFFSYGNRSAAIRIPKYATEPDKVRFEFRPPDATCNPYLAQSAMLLAGLDGILNRIDPTQEGFGPINEDVFSWPAEKRATIKSLPTSLGEAARALAADHEFLLQGEIFSREMIEQWVKVKTAEEFQLQLRPHPYELQQYFDI